MSGVFPGLVDVYRLEHVTNCTGRVGHGPFHLTGCRTSRPMPPFGMSGRAPRITDPAEVCGVTVAQARYWWSSQDVAVRRRLDTLFAWSRAGWSFVLYRVPESDARIDRAQVVFRHDRAHRIAEVGFPRFLLDDRRTTAESRNRYHFGDVPAGASW